MSAEHLNNETSTAFPLQPTVRLWIVGNPISGHGKGKECLTAISKALASQLTTWGAASEPIEYVNSVVWSASSFLEVSDSQRESSELVDVNLLFDSVYQAGHERLKPQKKRSWTSRVKGLISRRSAPSLMHSENVKPECEPNMASSTCRVVLSSPCYPSEMSLSNSLLQIFRTDGRSAEPHFEGPAIRAVTVMTEKSKDGLNIFRRIAELITKDLLRKKMSSLEWRKRSTLDYSSPDEPTRIETSEARMPPFQISEKKKDQSNLVSGSSSYVYPYMDILIIVGGDGTLSEAVNGIFSGVLGGYFSFIKETNASLQQKSAESVIRSMCLDDIKAQIEEECYLVTSVDEVLREKYIIQNLAPYVLYYPSGTGADFKKLGMCCRKPSQVVETIEGVSAAFFSALVNHREAEKASPPTTALQDHSAEIFSRKTVIDEEPQKKSSKCFRLPLEELQGRFRATSINVGRVSFLKTGNVNYFINICSAGMSVEVIQRSNVFRRSALMTAVGGTVIFGSSSFISLVKMAPLWIRVMPLPTRNHQSRSSLNFYQNTGDDSKNARDYINHINPLFIHNPNLYSEMEDTVSLLKQKRNRKHFGTDPLCNSNFFHDELKKKNEHCNFQHIVCKDAMEVRRALDFKADAPCQTKKVREQSIDEPKPTLTPDTFTPPWVYVLSSTMAFGNGRWYGGGMLITPHADPTDNLLSCTNWLTSFWTFVLGAFDLYDGNHYKWKSTSTFDGPRFILDSGPEALNGNPQLDDHDNPVDPADIARGSSTLLLEADGELIESLPALIELGANLTLLSPSGNSRNKTRGSFRFGKPIPGTQRHITETEKRKAGLTSVHLSRDNLDSGTENSPIPVQKLGTKSVSHTSSPCQSSNSSSDDFCRWWPK